MSSEIHEVVIVGAGLSGIGMACHLKASLPGIEFVILEGREDLGGTWDLFRYPGIRSDSDMHTLGYDFKPWKEAKAIADTHVATDDGSEGYKGLITDLLDAHLAELPDQELERLRFYNCGPEPMVHAAIAVQRKYVGDQQIFSAIDYLTKCGVGICGACAAPDGRRLCVDGPFLSA